MHLPWDAALQGWYRGNILPQIKWTHRWELHVRERTKERQKERTKKLKGREEEVGEIKCRIVFDCLFRFFFHCNALQRYVFSVHLGVCVRISKSERG